MTFLRFCARLLDIVMPPRPTEVRMRALTPEELRTLRLRGEKSGSLPYHDPCVQALVWELKYYANSQAAHFAALVLCEPLIGVASESLGTPLLIPVPMHAVRRRQRGHNQTEILCEAILTRAQGFFEYDPRLLVRTKATPPQQGLHKHQREHNLHNSMNVAVPARVRGRVCVVIDDVSTTGATFAEATRALLDAGARRVECIALAYS